jgi:hypothetical protein
MTWIAKHLRTLMLIAGVLTCSMLYVAIAPQAALQSNFGSTLDGPLAEIVVRNWGALIALVGATLIYGAYVPATRRLALGVAVLSKTVFIALVLIFGREFLTQPIGVAVVADALCVLVFGAYLLAGKPTAD